MSRVLYTFETSTRLWTREGTDDRWSQKNSSPGTASSLQGGLDDIFVIEGNENLQSPISAEAFVIARVPRIANANRPYHWLDAPFLQTPLAVEG